MFFLVRCSLFAVCCVLFAVTVVAVAVADTVRYFVFCHLGWIGMASF